jgi:hypothetical protein
MSIYPYFSIDSKFELTIGLNISLLFIIWQLKIATTIEDSLIYQHHWNIIFQQCLYLLVSKPLFISQQTCSSCIDAVFIS